MACVLLRSLRVTTSRMRMPPSRATSDVNPTDFDLLVELADVSWRLRSLRRDSATANADLRRRRSRVIHLEALLRADSVALATLRKDDADQVGVEILEDAIAGARKECASANDSAVSAADSLAPLLERLFRATTELERQAKAIRARLSPPMDRLLETLARRDISPQVARLEDNTCGECHMRLPTALANAIVRDSTVYRCPHCKRVVVPAASSELASAG